MTAINVTRDTFADGDWWTVHVGPLTLNLHLLDLEELWRCVADLDEVYGDDVVEHEIEVGADGLDYVLDVVGGPASLTLTMRAGRSIASVDLDAGDVHELGVQLTAAVNASQAISGEGDE